MNSIFLTIVFGIITIILFIIYYISYKRIEIENGYVNDFWYLAQISIGLAAIYLLITLILFLDLIT